MSILSIRTILTTAFIKTIPVIHATKTLYNWNLNSDMAGFYVFPFKFYTICSDGWESLVGITTPTGWMVRGSNPSRGKIFHTCPDQPWGLPSLQYNWYQVFPRGKVARAWRWPPTPI
jgi:hypothetical protein